MIIVLDTIVDLRQHRQWTVPAPKGWAEFSASERDDWAAQTILSKLTDEFGRNARMIEIDFFETTPQ